MIPPGPGAVGMASTSGSADSANPTAPSASEPDPSGCPPNVPGCPCLFDVCDGQLLCVAGVCELPVDETTSSDGGMQTGGETEADASDSTAAAVASEGTTGEVSTTTDATDATETSEETTGAPSDPCGGAFAGPGHYCGMSLGGESNVLYECNAEGETVAEHVGAGCPVCVVCPAGFADYCDGGFVPPSSCA